MHAGLKFLIGCGGIYLTFIGYGLNQEKLFRTKYVSGETAEKFTFSFAPILLISFLASIIATIADKVQPHHLKKPMPVSIKAKQGLFNSISMLGSMSALNHVSYPVQALFKSCKVLSVLMVGLLFGKFSYRKMEYVAGILVTAGILCFNLISAKSGGSDTSLIGVLILIVSLFSDGMLAEAQNTVRRDYHVSSFQLMQITSVTTFFFTLLYSIFSLQLPLFLEFCLNREGVIQDLVTVGLLGSVGQIFIFYTIKHFGPNVLAIITTTRKLFTVLFSIFVNGHHIEPAQWFCIFIVFSGVATEFYDSHNHRVQKALEKLKQEQQEKGASNNFQVDQNNDDSKPLKKKSY